MFDVLVSKPIRSLLLIILLVILLLMDCYRIQQTGWYLFFI